MKSKKASESWLRPSPSEMGGSSRIWPRLFLLLIFMFGNAPQLLAAPEFLALRSNAYTEELVAAAPALDAEIRAQLGFGLEGAVEIAGYERKEEFNAFAGRFDGVRVHDVLGIYVPAELDTSERSMPKIALNLAQIREYNVNVSTVLKHELAHAVLAEHIAQRLRPLWFEEGVAQWVSETPVEAMMGALGYAQGQGSDPRSFIELSMMLRDPQERGVGYAHALNAVTTIESDFGADRLREFFANLKSETIEPAGEANFDSIFAATFGTSFSQWGGKFLDSRYRSWWTRAFQTFGRDVFSSMMLVGVVLLLIALWRKRRRERGILAEMKIQEEIFPSSPDWAFDSGLDDDEDDFLEEIQEAEVTAITQKENADQGAMARSGVLFEDGDGYWTEEGWTPKEP